MDAIYFSENSVDFHLPACPNIPEDKILLLKICYNTNFESPSHVHYGQASVLLPCHKFLLPSWNCKCRNFSYYCPRQFSRPLAREPSGGDLAAARHSPHETLFSTVAKKISEVFTAVIVKCTFCEFVVRRDPCFSEEPITLRLHSRRIK